MKIEEFPIGNGFPCFVIGEVAQAHDGSLGAAHAYIDAVAKTGANAVKFQTHIAEAESTLDEKFRVRVFPQDATRYDYWRRMEFSSEQWAGLFDHARQRGLIFLSTPFSFEAVELLDRLGVPAWKVGSGEVGNLPMLKMMARTGKPVLLSSGMSSWSDLDDAFSVIRNHGSEIAVFQCTTAYPCPPDKIGLNLISDMKSRYGVPVGLSDHSGTIYPSLSAVTLGANLIEVHTVFSKECFGPDVPASVTTEDLRRLVDGIRFTEAMMLAPVDKDVEARDKKELSVLFGKSLYCKTDLQKGHKLNLGDIALKKPGTGIPARMLDGVVGKILKRDYRADEQLKESDLDG
ncbi:N-acetylneuraminic acid synthase NeuB family protein [Rhizobium etli bv. mimosae str. IE4771]|uniref:N-acetylneuraminic acid synthase NeuB family protein n=1 Tax=Rhizobium etli bv. mimosae str. IE4771 TaxID=1432050 RepID=A0A060HWR8_RHIET|nr:N-acetylneuraminate synthase family protein [Rhizobium sp. IE4771]AIC25964.1 N-acetylneuraminic acid synthase NeuB family protein [Rhizobium sp. IE4771]